MIHTTRADILQQMNRPEEALADLDFALTLDPRDTSIFYARGMLRTVIGRYDDAIDDFDVILGRRNDVNWIFTRGVAKYLKGDWSAAAADFQKVTRLAPGNDSYLIWLAKSALRAGVPMPPEQFAALDNQSPTGAVLAAFTSDYNPTQFMAGVRVGAGFVGAGAREMFESAEASCHPLSLERAEATAELRRLSEK